MNSLRKSTFVIDGIRNKTFEGYTNDEAWNGWACPYFEKSEAQRVLQASETNGYMWSYDASQDAFIVWNEEDSEGYDSEVFKAVKRNAAGRGQVTVYGIGAYSWTWQEAELVE